MKSLVKATTLGIAIAAIACLLFISNNIDEAQAARSKNPLNFPVLLVHGLGETSGDEAFGNLESYLENFFFKVETIDFNAYTDHDVLSNVAGKNWGTLSHLAAVLGRRIVDLQNEYNVEKVNIVAHSYGGLIVQAFLLNMGAEINDNWGAFDDNVERVVYIQTPFYGSALEDDTPIWNLVNETDYGIFKDVGRLVRTSKMGNIELVNMDQKLRSGITMPYGPDIDLLTLASDSDEIFGVHEQTLYGTTDELFAANRTVIFNGYKHSSSTFSAADSEIDKGSMAHIENITDEAFVAIVSFLDAGKKWQTVSNIELPETGFAMVHIDTHRKYRNLDPNDVKFSYSKQLSTSTSVEPAGMLATAEPPRDDPKVYYNADERTWVFYGFSPGIYDLKIKNDRNDGVDQEFRFTGRDQVGFFYVPNDNQLFEGDRVVNSSLKGIVVIPQFRITQLMSEAYTQPIDGLDTDGFEVEWTVTQANDGAFDKGRTFVLYNQSGSNDSSWNRNGSRVEIQHRGWEVFNNDHVHSGKATAYGAVDKNKNGNAEYLLGEDFEHKTTYRVDWKDEVHSLMIRVQTNKQGFCDMTFWLDGKKFASHEFSSPYWNPDPYLSFGGRRHDKDYQAAVNALITDFVIRNIGKEK